MKSMNSIILVILISAGGVSLAMAVTEVPALWSSILSWLRPPYLHIVINAIIITIAAASHFCRNQPAPPVRPQHLISYKTPPPAYYAAYSSPPEVSAMVEAAAEAIYESDDRVVELKPVMVNGREVAAEDEGEIAFADRTLTYDTPSPERFTPEFQLEYFPAVNPTRNVAERRRNETEESTWKTIREGPSRAAQEESRHDGEPWPAPDHRFRYNTRKSKSFKERTTYNDSPPSHVNSGKRKKASPSRNKLNRRVEADVVSVDRSLTHKSPSPELLLPENDPRENIPQRVRERPPPTTEEEYETLESAWKKVTEGASRAAAAEEEARYVGAPRPSPGVLKSSSFKERPAIYNDSPPSRASLGIQKEVSPSQDELNRRVEAFIKKVNDEIRLRRQKSSNQYIQLNSAA
ncbi:hypothetical protein C2S53_008668 [Perilla frutescens var. hirtella]|uniref:DUF4408 domain-containing protein n=1 Tax=Perilla frutescens var. hirtella TaxID=608512 RepID=A0AAD4J0U6_PERFH|nr:hypothetical protein C2S53_008668 [Perilla frutescens var. hirtella]